MTQVSSRIVIHAPADAIWQMISDFGAAGDYLAEIIDCAVEGEGVGALRVLTSVNGSTVVERLDTLDAMAQRLSYALLTDTPFGNCLTSMALRDLGPNQTELTWSATFKADGIPENEAVELLESALLGNCMAFKWYMEDGAS